MEIIDRVPFDLVGAYHERETEHGRLVGAARGPIGKILRRHRMDSSTALIHSMLKACVEKRWDMMLWETFADAIRRELSHLAPADIGLVLFCCVKAQLTMLRGIKWNDKSVTSLQGRLPKRPNTRS
eukprot:g15938.t1